MIMNNDNNNNYRGGGIGFFGLLTIVFIALKLAGVINWSWIWILAPLWVPTVIVILIVLICAFIAVYKDYKIEEQRKRYDRYK